MPHSKKEYDDLKRAVPLWQVVQPRVPSLEQVGAEFKACCPFHAEDTPSFTLYQGEDGIWLFKCFGCNKNGNVVQFVAEMDKISMDAAFDKVASLANWKEGQKNVEQTFQPTLKEKKEIITFPVEKIADAAALCQNHPAARAWLDSRGITLETARRFKLGFVQSARAVNPFHPWVDEGWIVFPTLSVDAQSIISLKYRSIKGKKTPDGKMGFMCKDGMTTALFNLQAVQPFYDVYLVEGEPDCMVLEQAGYVAVSLPSASYNPTGPERDRLMQANRIFLAGDMDNAGQAAMTKLWSELRERTYRLEWPGGMKDANQTFLEHSNGDVEKFRQDVEGFKKKALEQPMPFMYDLRESLYSADATKPMDNPARLRMPWSNIDSWTAILPGDVVAVTATETGTGKTSWIMDVLLENAIKYGKIVVNYSAEVLPAQYSRRAAAYLTQIPKDSLAKEDMARAAELMGEAKFYNGYKPGANYKDVVELLKWAKRRLGADIVVVDHLHFLTRSERDETKAQSEAMRMFKDMALDFNIIVIVVGQPRKPLANHRGREAVTQDMKGSEAFGSDASQVFILHRDRKSNGDDENMPIFSSETKVKLDKSRESEPRATKLYFDGARCSFVMLDRSSAFVGEYDA